LLNDTQTPRSPDWWLLRLGHKLENEINRMNRLDAYRVGQPPIPTGNHKMRETYRRFQHLSRTAFAGLVVETVLERLKIVGFRTGAAETQDEDRTAWEWWQQNHMDADSGLVHRAAVTMSRAYVSIGRDEDNPGKPLVCGEDPRQTIHEASPTNRRKLLAVMKAYWDDIYGCHRAVVTLPKTIFYFKTVSSVKQEVGAGQLYQAQQWQVDTDQYPEGSAPNELGECPYVVFVNRPDLAGHGTGEFEDVIDVLGRIDTTVLDRMVISAMQAYRQRWATGVDNRDKNGQPIDTYEPGADLLWEVPDAGAKFGDFDAADLSPIIKSIESDVQYLAAVTRTPPHYLLAGITNVSGDALGAAETGLVCKLGERQTEYGESWEEVNRLVGKLMGNEVAPDAEILWKDPQFRTLSELADGVSKLVAAGVPWRARMEIFGATPSTIDRWEAQRAADALLSDSLAPLALQEGGELGTRGVLYSGKGAPDQTGGTDPVTNPGPTDNATNKTTTPGVAKK
jgi:Phage portal protein, SPP1 Gp6-like